RPGGGDVRRAAGRDGPGGVDLPAPAAPVHRRADEGGAGPGSPRAERRRGPERRGAEPGRATGRVLLPPAVPVRRGAVPDRAPGAAAGGARSPRPPPSGGGAAARGRRLRAGERAGVSAPLVALGVVGYRRA